MLRAHQHYYCCLNVASDEQKREGGIALDGIHTTKYHQQRYLNGSDWSVCNYAVLFFHLNARASTSVWAISRCSSFHSRYHTVNTTTAAAAKKNVAKKKTKTCSIYIRALPTHDYNFNTNDLLHIKNMESIRFVRACVENGREIEVKNFTRIFMRIMSTHS